MAEKYINRKNVVPMETSPFENQTLESIRLGKKTVAYAETREVIDGKTGRVMDEVATVGLRRAVDKTEFIKLYQQGVKQMIGLNASAIKALGALLLAYRDDKKNFTDQIFVSYRVAGEYGYENTRSYWIKGINELIKAGFIQPKPDPGFYFINPAYFFKGNRVQLVKEYINDMTTQELLELKSTIEKNSV